MINQLTVDAQNTLNRKADQFEPAIIALLRDHFLGKKVWLISGYGGLSAPLKKAIAALETEHGIGGPDSDFFLIIRGEFGLWAELGYRFSEPTDHGYSRSHCIRADFRIGRKDDDGILTEPEAELTYPDGRPQFELEAVKAAAAEARKLEEQARDLRSSISVFERIR